MTDDLGQKKRELAVYKLPHLVHEREICEPSVFGPWMIPTKLSPIYTREVGYKTGSGNMMSLLIEAYRVDRSQIPLLTEYEQVSFCGDCKGSSGGCPGFAPRFDHLRSRDSSDFVVITISIDMIWAIMYATPKDGWKGRRILKQLMYADRITESYCKRLLTFLKGANAGFPLGAGNCMGCRPKFCTVIRGKKCAKPRKRTYSMEAVGVDCDELHIMLYGEPLPWYYKGTNKMMTYMTRYMGIFPSPIIRGLVGIDEYLHGFIYNDKSYIDIYEVPESRDATISLMEIPHGVYKGGHIYVYNDPGLVSKEESNG